MLGPPRLRVTIGLETAGTSPFVRRGSEDEAHSGDPLLSACKDRCLPEQRKHAPLSASKFSMLSQHRCYDTQMGGLAARDAVDWRPVRLPATCAMPPRRDGSEGPRERLSGRRTTSKVTMDAPGYRLHGKNVGRFER